MATPGAFEVIALSFSQIEPGRWERYLIRQCHTCDHPRIERLLYVNLNHSVCLHCLSQDVTALRRPPPAMAAIACNECGAITELEHRDMTGDHPPPPGDDDDEDEYGSGPFDPHAK